ncbi:MAG: hypothetical protein GX630_02075 [Actinobacteria bacterium]|nr:hypothetical protein [Actinomycetota bacterium]
MQSVSLGSRRPRRALHTALCSLIVAVMLLLVVLGGATSAQATTIITPYPAMTVQPGQTVKVTLTVADTVAQRVDLSLQGVPADWEVSFMGAGRPVTALMTEPDSVRTVDLQVEVPYLAAEGTSTITVRARSANGETVSLPISFTVSEAEGGTTELTAEYSSVRGPADATFTFSLKLANKTPEERTYNLTASGPENWKISLTPTGQTQETPTVAVESQGSQGMSLKVTPAANVEMGTYEIVVTASGGGETVSVPLQIEITGTYTLSLTTPDGNLNAEVKTGDTTKAQFVVTNSGTGPLQDVKLSATAPANWEVVFEPRVIEVLPANQQMTVTASFTPAKNAIAGDYLVTLRASGDQADAQSDIRVTVKTSTLWGVIGVLIAIAAIAILAFVFRRFGHR